MKLEGFGEEFVWTPKEHAAREDLHRGRAKRACDLLRDPGYELSQPLRDALAAILEQVTLPRPRHTKAEKITTQRAKDILALFAKEFPRILKAERGDKAAADAEFARQHPEEHQLIPAAKEKLKPSEQRRLFYAMVFEDGKEQSLSRDETQREWERIRRK